MLAVLVALSAAIAWGAAPSTSAVYKQTDNNGAVQGYIVFVDSANWKKYNTKVEAVERKPGTEVDYGIYAPAGNGDYAWSSQTGCHSGLISGQQAGTFAYSDRGSQRRLKRVSVDRSWMWE